MDIQQQRHRSPSIGHQADQRIRHSPSPQHFLDHTSHTDAGSPNSAFTSQIYDQSLSSINASGGQYELSAPYLDPNTPNHSSHAPFQSHVLPSNDFNEHGFGQAYQPAGLGSTFEHGSAPIGIQQTDQQFHGDMLNVEAGFGEIPQHQPGFDKQQPLHLDNSFLLDPQLQVNSQAQQEQSINPADIMGDMSSPHDMHTSPPSLMPPHPQGSEPPSPFSTSGHQWSPNHSRSASLDPSAAYTNGQQTDWTGVLQGAQFHTHRRAPSEHSDVSSIMPPSPFTTNRDNFDSFDQRSPMVQAQPDQQYPDVLGIESVSLSDAQNFGTSPRHSPFVSPMMSPQRDLGPGPDQNFMPMLDSQNNFNGSPNGDQFHPQTEQFPTFPPEHRLPSNDYGQADQLAPPEINVEFAPTNQPRVFEPQGFQGDFDALMPERGRRGGGRERAKSETYISRPVTPASSMSSLRSNNPSIGQRGRSGSLSPYDSAQISPNFSRESSPAVRSPSQRRSSTSAIPNRDYILELADPSRPSAPGMEKRVQKHPATFQCHLCPKKFTRAYNLRSHLRTHTDERPFVCNVCSKAFARQHDRKRHEGLHSGEKKFVCKGELGQGGTWGCGRRFARADALGRHFRSEAGRVCIKPLLDEEAFERQRTMDGQMMNQSMQMGGLAPQPSMNGMSQGAFTLPAALLQQYPALQNLQWDQLSAGPDEGDISGRSSFDAGSGGEYYDEDDEGSGYVSDNPMASRYEGGSDWQGNPI